MKGGLLPVEQRHRDAVIAYLRAHHYASADWIERGDHHPLVDAFAAFERDHLSDLTAQLDKAREALEEIKALEVKVPHGTNGAHPIALSVAYSRAVGEMRHIAARACLPATSGDVG